MPDVYRPHRQVAMFWVGSQLKPTSTATLDQYHQYYNEELVTAVLKASFPNGPKTIVRYKNETASSGGFAFAALAPMQDLRLVYGPVLDRALARKRSAPTKVFEGDTGYQHVDFNNLSYRYIHVIEGEKHEDTDAYPLTMVADSCNAPREPLVRIREEALFKAKYQLPKRFRKCEHYWQSLVYKLLLGKASRYLVLHFFDCEHDKLGQEFLAAGADGCVDRQVYSLLSSQGEMIYPPPPNSSKAESGSEKSCATKKSGSEKSCTSKKSSSRKSGSDKQSAPCSSVTALDWILY